MKIGGFTMAAVAAALALGVATTSAQTGGGVARAVGAVEPVVVELFTAQGCAGCPEANGLVEPLADRPGVILLTWPVDYWDWQGWKDTLARPAFSARQRDYVEALRLRAPSTPQVIVDGRRTVPAVAGALDLAVAEETRRRVWPPDMAFRDAGARIGVGRGEAPEGGAEVVAVIFTPGVQTVRVDRGDNRGKTVRQVNVVRRVAPLGPWTGRPGLYDLPDDLAAGDGVAVLVQSRADRVILAAALR